MTTSHLVLEYTGRRYLGDYPVAATGDDGQPTVLSTLPVEFALVPAGTRLRDGSPVWRVGAWVSLPDTRFRARTGQTYGGPDSGADVVLTRGLWDVYLRVVGIPERPAFHVDTIEVR